MKTETSKKHKAVVLGLTLTGLGVVRGLARQGIPVIGAASAEYEAGFSSRYCQRMLCPALLNNESEALDFLIRLGQKLNPKPVLIPTGDAIALLVSKHRATLKQYYHFVLPDEQLLEDIINKKSFYELADRHDIPIPRYFVPSSKNSIESIAREVNYPCIIKPSYSHEWRKDEMIDVVGLYSKVMEINSADELIKTYEKIAPHNNRMIVQELIIGGDDQLYSVYVYLNRQSRAVAYYIARKLRMFPVHYGMGSFVESVVDDEIAELGVDILQRIGYKGIGGVCFKRDQRDGRLKVFEINSRFNFYNSLGTRCGVNLPLVAYRDALGENSEPITTWQGGIKWLYLQNDLMALRDYRARGEISTWQWLKSIMGTNTHGLFAWDDPLPFFKNVIYLTKILVKKLLNIKNN